MDEISRWLFVILGTVTWIYGVFGNVLVLCTLVGQPVVRSTHNIFIGNLALADLYIVGYGLSYWVWDLATDEHPTANDLHCLINGYLAFVCTVASILFLWTISLNRYVSICHHSTYRRWLITRRRTTWFCVAVWASATAFSAVPFFGPGEYLYEVKFHSCFLNRSDTDSYVHITTTVPMVFILASIAFFNVSIFRFWRRNKKQMKRWTAIKSLTTGTRGTADNAEKAPTPIKKNSVKRIRHNTENTVKLSDTSDAHKLQSKESANLTIRHNSYESEKAHSQGSSGIANMTNTASSGIVESQHTGDTVNEKEMCSICTDASQHQASPETETTSLKGNAEHGQVFSINTFVNVVYESETATTTVNTVRATHTDKKRWSGNSPPEGTTEDAAVGKKDDSLNALRSKTPNAHNSDRSTKPVNSASSDRALVRSLLAVYLCLAVFYTTAVVVGALEGLVQVPEEVALTSSFLFFTNSSVNWLIYAAFNKTFRLGYRNLLASCCQRRNRVHDVGQ